VHLNVDSAKMAKLVKLVGMLLQTKVYLFWHEHETLLKEMKGWILNKLNAARADTRTTGIAKIEHMCLSVFFLEALLCCMFLSS